MKSDQTADPLWTRIAREILIVVLSAVGAMIVPFNFVTFGVIRTPDYAFTLMFFLYSHSYLLLKRWFLKKSIRLRVFEFELVNLVLTAYMVVLLPITRNKPDIIQLPACYWTFIFISIYVSVRGGAKKVDQRI